MRVLWVNSVIALWVRKRRAPCEISAKRRMVSSARAEETVYVAGVSVTKSRASGNTTGSSASVMMDNVRSFKTSYVEVSFQFTVYKAFHLNAPSRALVSISGTFKSQHELACLVFTANVLRMLPLRECAA